MPDTPPRIAVILAGPAGISVAKRLANTGCAVLANLPPDSPIRECAHAAGLQDTSLADIARTADYVLTILAPQNAIAAAETFQRAAAETARALTYVDFCAVGPETARRVAALFDGTRVDFVDVGALWGPPKTGYVLRVGGGRGRAGPLYCARSIRAADRPANGCRRGRRGRECAEDVVRCEQATSALTSVLDAAGLQGITKGMTGLFISMVLAAHASSPATASALLHELQTSQPGILRRLARSVPAALCKAPRLAPEMEEISAFVGGAEGGVYAGLASVFERVGRREGDDAEVLERFAEEAKKGVDGSEK